MKLINGPYNGREIEDSGTVRLRMCITEDGTSRKGVRCGTALYEHSEDRSMAFWSHNEWDGTLEGVIPA
jgi:hypothetical protein